MFYIKLASSEVRANFISFMKAQNIITPFHYIPLHSSPAGEQFGNFFGYDVHTSTESSKLVRLPLYFGMTKTDQEKVIVSITEFFHER